MGNATPRSLFLVATGLRCYQAPRQVIQVYLFASQQRRTSHHRTTVLDRFEFFFQQLLLIKVCVKPATTDQLCVRAFFG